MSSLEEKIALRNRLQVLANAMITNRSINDVRSILALSSMAYDDMSSANKTFMANPQKGAYNYDDRNRVSEYCNKLVTLMSDYYGRATPDYTVLSESWQNIYDPSRAQLTTYIASIIAVRNYWYSYLEIPGSVPQISNIYTGISLATANNIEKALKTINQYLNDKIFSVDDLHCGQLLGASNTYVIRSGINIYMGAM